MSNFKNKNYRPLDVSAPITDRYVDAYLEQVRKHAFTSAILTDELESEIREFFPKIYKAYGFELYDEHIAEIPTKHFDAVYEKSGVTQHQARLLYNPYRWVFSEDPAGWPSGWWFRFGQEQWERSTWRLLPALPASMLAAMGYPLVTSCRYMGNLTDDQKVELLKLLMNHDARGWSTEEEVARTKELLALTSYGMELPIIDIDTVKPPKGTPVEKLDETRELIGRTAVKYALAMTEAWKEIFGVGVHWTVTNDRGGLHGRSLPLPPDLHHPELLMMLTEALVEQCKKRGVPYKSVGGRGEWKDTDLAVLDISTFQKSGAGRGGMWRTPGSKKDAHMGPGSLPQTPVSKLVSEMPWLSAVTPEALGSDWAPISDEIKKKILGLCDAFSKRKQEKEIKAGRAYVKDGKLVRVRVAAVEADAALGTTEFKEVALTVRELMPQGENEGMKRHDLRLAVAGWLYTLKLPEAAASATLVACGGNIEDSMKVVRTTYTRARGGDKVAGMWRLKEILGVEKAKKLDDALAVDLMEKVGSKGPDPADSREGDDGGDVGDNFGSDDLDTLLQGPQPSPAPSITTPTSVPPETPASKPWPEPPVATLGPETDEGVLAATSKLHPRTALQLKFREAKARGSYVFDPATGELEKTRVALAEIKNSCGDSFYFFQKTIAQNLAFARVGLDIMTRTALRGAVRFSSLRSDFMDADKELKRWSEGKPLPKFTPLSAIRRTLGHWRYRRLLDAISDDLHNLGAPFDVQNRATVDATWTGRERDNMKYFVDRMIVGKDGKPDYTKIKGALQFIEDARRCGYLVVDRICPDHGEISKIPVVCEREISCKYCRNHLYNAISEWVAYHWKHDKYVTFEIPATEDAVVKEIRRKLEVDANGKVVDKTVASTPEDEASKHILLPKSHPDEKRFRAKWNERKNRLEVKIKMRRRSRHKVEGRKLVKNLLDRIKLGFTHSKDFKEFKKLLGKRIGVRAWPTTTGICVVMPSTFMPSEEVGADGLPPEEKPTMLALQEYSLWENVPKKVISKDEALTLILDARAKIGEGFDRLIYYLGQEPHKLSRPDIDVGRQLLQKDLKELLAKKPVDIEPGTPKYEEALQGFAEEAKKLLESWGPSGKPSDLQAGKRFLEEKEEELRTYPFLRNGAMRPVKNKRAEIDMPWFTKEQIREFMKMLKREREGTKIEDEVSPHECPMPVPDTVKGGEKPCRRVLRCELHCEHGILAANNQGQFYARDKAWETAEGLGIAYGSIPPAEGRFAPSAVDEKMLA